jgi:hypothetical protein
MANTVIYYSCQNENPVFEQKIMDNIKLQAKCPIISVTHKPVDLGKNICVGDKPICYSNSFKQLLMGLREATTEFCVACEADVLYPPEYFSYIPPRDDAVFRYTNVWVHFADRDKFWKKKFSEGAQVCGREYWIKSIEAILGNPDSWDYEPLKFIFPNDAMNHWTGNPIITFKTREAVNFKTGYEKESVTELPFWGTAEEVRLKYL